jgi:hypothetical protein
MPVIMYMKTARGRGGELAGRATGAGNVD